MFKKLDALTDRFRELSEAIAQPEIIQDYPSYQAYLKELSSLEPLVRTYDEYNSVESAIKDTGELLSDPDFSAEAERKLLNSLPGSRRLRIN